MEKLEDVLEQLKEKQKQFEEKVVFDDADSFHNGFGEGFEYGITYCIEKIEKILKEDE